MSLILLKKIFFIISCFFFLNSFVVNANDNISKTKIEAKSESVFVQKKEHNVLKKQLRNQQNSFSAKERIPPVYPQKKDKQRNQQGRSKKKAGKEKIDKPVYRIY